jgi:hypothetical protein
MNQAEQVIVLQNSVLSVIGAIPFRNGRNEFLKRYDAGTGREFVRTTRFST